MRRSDPIIVGAGPAGCAAAITLARAGARPLILEKASDVGDALCGGFLSWRTLDQLAGLGVAVSGHRIDELRVYSGTRVSAAPLPFPALGVSRRHMDTALLAAARQHGTGFEGGVTVRHLEDLQTRSDAIFLATGKHDLKGAERPRDADDPAMGLRVRLPSTPGMTRLIGSGIELHMFDRGYAGIELQEDGSANICLALRKSLLTEHGRSPHRLLRALGDAHPAFAERLMDLSDGIPLDAVANVPYGWRARQGTAGLFRIGDQAGVIPSLAGEGNGIALASGRSAAMAWLDGGADAAAPWQTCFAAQSRRPIGIATAVWRASERPLGRSLISLALSAFPQLAAVVARATRISA